MLDNFKSNQNQCTVRVTSLRGAWRDIPVLCTKLCFLMRNLVQGPASFRMDPISLFDQLRVMSELTLCDKSIFRQRSLCHCLAVNYFSITQVIWSLGGHSDDTGDMVVGWAFWWHRWYGRWVGILMTQVIWSLGGHSDDTGDMVVGWAFWWHRWYGRWVGILMTQVIWSLGGHSDANGVLFLLSFMARESRLRRMCPSIIFNKYCWVIKSDWNSDQVRECIIDILQRRQGKMWIKMKPWPSLKDLCTKPKIYTYTNTQYKPHWVWSLSLSAGFTPCRHLRSSLG